MQFLFKSKANDAPVEGVDWIVVTANAVAVAIVMAATLNASVTAQYSATTDPSTDIELASLK
jgi:hypothetical protein